MTRSAAFILICLWGAGAGTKGSAQNAAATVPSTDADRMQMEFVRPPMSAKPRVWWHWMNGNITEDGIIRDLDWMERVGLGGFTVFEGSLDTPQVVSKRLVYMTPEWQHAFQLAVNSGTKRGLEVAISSSAGWSETGGPWVLPSDAMKKFVWSETLLQGGREFLGDLAPLPTETGSFQNYSLARHRSSKPGVLPLPQLSSDAAVVAYRVPESEANEMSLHPAITTSQGEVNPAALSDGDIDTPAAVLPRSTGNAAWLQFDFGHVHKVCAVTLATTDDIASFFGFSLPDTMYPTLEASDDGVHFRVVTRIPFSSIAQRTIAFESIEARFFRVVFPAPMTAKTTSPHEVTELVLHTAPRLNEWERRAGFATVLNYNSIQDYAVDAGSTVRHADVVDLSSSMDASGKLHWNPPPGQWSVLRIGYSLIGRENGPAPAEATGLEADKLDAGAVKRYIDHYLQNYSDTVGAGMMGSHGITHLLTDSIETGPQNWTGNMLREFARRRGYSAIPWLPALTGVVIDDTSTTKRFLWDFRMTIAELFSESHYDVISSELHAHGLRYYGEALEFHRPSLGDDMEMRSHTDIPMGAMWTFPEKSGPNPTYVADLEGAASVAHIYGQNLVGAEAMTAAAPQWTWSPNTLKRIADMAMALGTNRFEIHESTHQPLPDKAPGLTLGIYGQWFNRNETWAEEAGPWVQYLARSSYLLQQGRFYADVAYFYGEDTPLTGLFGDRLQQDAPEGFGFDFVNRDALLRLFAVSHGLLTTPSGARYRLLYLGGTSMHMTVPVLRKLKILASRGAVIAGNRPVSTPSLADDDKDFHQLVDELWGEPGAAKGFAHRVGRGWVYEGLTAGETLKQMSVRRDFDYTRTPSDTKLLFVHRKLSDGDIYFVDSRNEREQVVNTNFRITGKLPELWDAATGKTSQLPYKIAEGLTTIPLHFDPYGAVFVIFRKPVVHLQEVFPNPRTKVLADLSRGWQVYFQKNRGAPASARFDQLASWANNSDPGIRFFSGSATYTKTADLSADWIAGHKQLWLDLGDVREIASVEVNGKSCGITWKTPFQVDISKAVHSGANTLTVRVTNLWVNRLIGDEQPGTTQRYTFTDIKPYTATSPLLPSGLLGPVRLLSVD